MLNQPFCLCTVCQVLTLTSRDIIGLLECARSLLLRFVFQEASFEWLCWIEVDLLCHESLLILQHLFTRVTNKAQLVHIDLDFVLIVLECAQHSKSVTDAHIVCAQPGTDL